MTSMLDALKLLNERGATANSTNVPASPTAPSPDPTAVTGMAYESPIADKVNPIEDCIEEKVGEEEVGPLMISTNEDIAREASQLLDDLGGVVDELVEEDIANEVVDDPTVEEDVAGELPANELDSNEDTEETPFYLQSQIDVGLETALGETDVEQPTVPDVAEAGSLSFESKIPQISGDTDYGPPGYLLGTVDAQHPNEEDERIAEESAEAAGADHDDPPEPEETTDTPINQTMVMPQAPPSPAEPPVDQTMVISPAPNQTTTHEPGVDEPFAENKPSDPEAPSTANKRPELPTLRLQNSDGRAITVAIEENVEVPFASRLAQIDPEGAIIKPEPISPVQPTGISVEQALEQSADDQRRDNVGDSMDPGDDLQDFDSDKLPFDFFGGDAGALSPENLLSDTAFAKSIEQAAERQNDTAQQDQKGEQQAPFVPSVHPENPRRNAASPTTDGPSAALKPTRATVFDTIQSHLKSRRLATEYHTIWNAIRQNMKGGITQGNILFCDCEYDRPAAETLIYLAAVSRDGDSRTVLILDADLEEAKLSTKLGLDKTIGFSELCLGADLDGLIQSLDVPHTSVLPVGVNRTEVNAKGIQAAMSQLTQIFDFVLISGGISSHRMVPELNKACGTAYLVVRLGTTDRNATIDAVNSLHSAGVELGGCIVANIEADQTVLS